MRYAIVENGLVVNPNVVAEAPLDETWYLIPEGVPVKRGDSYKEGVFCSPSPEKAPIEQISEPKKPLVPVSLDTVSGQLTGYDNLENEYTVAQQSNAVIATGKVAVSDRKVKVPFKRIDTGRIQLMPGEIKNGTFSISLTFETNGIWIINQELINDELPEPSLSCNEYRFSVI